MLENTDITQFEKQTLLKLNTTQKKQTTQNTAKQNCPGSVTFYNTRPGNEVGLLYNAPEPTRGMLHRIKTRTNKHKRTTLYNNLTGDRQNDISF